MGKITVAQAAKQLGISVDQLSELEEKGLFHILRSKNKEEIPIKEIERVKSYHGLSLSEEAAQVRIEMQRETATSVTSLQRLKSRISVLSIASSLIFTLTALTVAILFNVFPVETSDFFGYYYRFNAQNPANTSEVDNNLPAVLGVSTDPVRAPVETSILADIAKPVAAASLLVVKAVDRQKYEQIVVNPILAADLTARGPSGSQGVAGDEGPQGLSGSPGVPGLSGVDGSSVANIDISNLTNANFSGSAGITNNNLANSALTIAIGDGLIGGGRISLGSLTTLDVKLAASESSGLTSSISGLEISDDGLTLLHGCLDGELLKWDNSDGWSCAEDIFGSDIQHAASYDTDEELTNIPTGGAQVVLGTVSVTPTTVRADVYVSGWAEVLSSNGADQPLEIAVETTDDCTGSIVGNASVVYTITSGGSNLNERGTIRVSGIETNPGAISQDYSLCAAVTSGSGDSDIRSWGLEALVID